MRPTPRTLVVAAIVSISLIGAAQAQQLYRWVDSEGVTHYSDSVPDVEGYETRQVRQAGTLSTREPAPAEPDADVLAAAAGTRPADPQRPEKCRQARTNLELLSSDQELNMDLDDDGQVEPLDDTARQAQIAIANQQIAAFCD
ncbi:MAG: hypothetical protein CVV17_03750 [Gammaproteobacteria bacterium HGW-Gammaproteobacteria-7]|nr:MAG: hypothetical protein CVV17_03750 [Gammaproteobacteria bacterium HGW-Gammaproteobacteria-7]